MIIERALAGLGSQPLPAKVLQSQYTPKTSWQYMSFIPTAQADDDILPEVFA